jgi:hypothetical protein
MKLLDVVRALSLRDLTGVPELLEADVAGAYASDLLSDILANAPEGGLSLTIQAHMNAVAVAVHARQVALLFTSSRLPPDDVVVRARAHGVALLATDLCTFDAAGRLYELGLRGRPELSKPYGAGEEASRA